MNLLQRADFIQNPMGFAPVGLKFIIVTPTTIVAHNHRDYKGVDSRH